MKDEKSGPEVSVETDEEMLEGVIPPGGLHALLISTLNGQPFRTRLKVPGLGLKPTVASWEAGRAAWETRRTLKTD
jgi:hypothetical protein